MALILMSRHFLAFVFLPSLQYIDTSGALLVKPDTFLAANSAFIKHPLGQCSMEQCKDPTSICFRQNQSPQSKAVCVSTTYRSKCRIAPKIGPRHGCLMEYLAAHCTCTI